MRLRWTDVPNYAAATLVTIVLLGIVLYEPGGLTEVPVVGRLACGGKEVDVHITNQHGNETLLRPDSGVHATARAPDGEPVDARLELYVRDAPGDEWRLHWTLQAPDGKEIFYLPQVGATMEAQVKAADRAQELCPGDSNVLRAASA